MNAGTRVTIGPKTRRRTFTIDDARRIGLGTVRYVLRPEDGGRRMIAYGRPGARLPWNVALADGPESFTS